ncbi:DUF6048 family protein [Reichenbachiella sp. MALMAid0571]|uniref:DUF6048 family protein n=1 Tax=Reichenbachiella sp. MALMAid0571 TaxID=3143939 RepID=UPI0032DEDC85
MLAVCQFAYAQEEKLPAKETTATPKTDSKDSKPKVERDFKPSAVNVGMEAIGLGRTAISSGFTQLEAQADIDFDRYFFVVDLGHERNSIANDEFNYSNKGNYIRMGVQVNMMPYNPDRNFFFFGFRYARSNFSDEIQYTGDFDKWGQKSISLANNGVSARWYEMTMGLKVKVFERLYFGYTLRYKIGKKMTGFDELTPRNIPGFGRADKNSNAGFNYYLLYNIPFRNKPIPKKPKRVFRERSDSTPSNQSLPSNSFQNRF